MTHIENIPHILQCGITHSTSPNANPHYMPIGDGSLIATRNEFLLGNGRRLGEYIPFYFGVRTPMLYVIQNGFNMVTPIPPENIVYCVISIQKIIELQLDFVFTDGHAVDGFSTQYSPSDTQNIDTILDRNAINARYWRDENDLDLKRRKEAEFLVLGDVAADAIKEYIVSNESAKERIINFGANSANVHIQPAFYF